MNHRQDHEEDVLRYRFTAWLKIVIYHARIDYLRKNMKNEISIEELDDDKVPSCNEIKVETRNTFDFEDDRLAFAFCKLSFSKQRVLNMLFVKEMQPEEIAAELHCTVQHVYNQRSLAIKSLMKYLKDGDGK